MNSPIRETKAIRRAITRAGKARPDDGTYTVDRADDQAIYLRWSEAGTSDLACVFDRDNHRIFIADATAHPELLDAVLEEPGLWSWDVHTVTALVVNGTCCDCSGDGYVPIEAVVNCSAATQPQQWEETCKTCEGRGRL